MIYIANKKTKEATLIKKYPNALILDVSSKGKQPWVKLSPFFPHNDIPVPFSEGVTAMSVEGIWQGLKVFQYDGIDTSKFRIADMKDIKRTVRKFGKPLGHQKGVNSKELLDYPTARKEIYLYSYAWILDNKVIDIIQALKYLAKIQDIVLLDYNTNEDLEDYSKPLSHAALVKKYLVKKYPELATLTFAQPTKDVKNKKTTVKGSSQKATKSKSKKQKDIDNQPSLF